MRIDLMPEGGGVVIEGTFDELDALADTIALALEDGEAAGSMLTDEAVETVTVRNVSHDD